MVKWKYIKMQHEIQKINEKLEKHFTDDITNFNNLSHTLTKQEEERQKRHGEILAITTESYNNREIDLKFSSVHEKLDDISQVQDKILTQTTAHNSRMSKIERILLIVGCVTGTLLISNGSQLVEFIKSII